MTTLEREISRDYKELDKLLAELRVARKKVEAWDTVSLPKPKGERKTWGAEGR